MNIIGYYNKFFSIFLDSEVDQEVLLDYLEDRAIDAHVELTDDIGMKLKKEFHWMTNVSILDMADLAVESASSNGNIKIN